MIINPVNPLENITPQLRQLNTNGHHLIADVPNTPYFMNQLREMEARANGHVEAQVAKLNEQYQAKCNQLEKLEAETAEAFIFAVQSARVNFEWYFDLIFAKSIAMNLELRQAKRKIQAEADEKVAAWQATAEAIYGDNEGLRARLQRYEDLVKELKRAKKPERVINLVNNFEVTK